MESAPFAGVVLCCTSIPVDLRTSLAKKVEELGGVHKNDLTHEVTHLIVGDYNTPKYRHVALDRPDIKPMCVGWVDAVRDLWTRDAPIDFPALEAAWQLRTFEVHGGLPAGPDEADEAGAGGNNNEGGGEPGDAAAAKRGRLLCSVTGFEEEDRQAVIALIVDNGGVYSGDLTRAVTHLIVNKPEGKKYNAALHWNIKTVAIEWLHDSVARGMILDESKYDPRLPANERGKDAWGRNNAERTASILGKRLRDAAAQAAAAEKQNGQRKLRKTTSQKLSVQRDDLWGDILGKPAQPSPAAGPAPPQAAATEARKSATPAADSSKPTNGADIRKPPQKAPAPPAEDVSNGGVLSTSIFCIHGFSPERTNVLAGAVATMGGAIASSLAEMAAIASRRPDTPLFQHVIVPQEERPETHPAVANDVLLVTEFFIERCLHKKQYALSGGPSTTLAQAPNPGTIGRPFAVFPIPGFATLSICSSGFTGVDLNQIDKTVRQLGAKYEERFTAQCSVLVVTSLPAVRKQKLELALSWKVPVVEAKWLQACIKSGTLVPVGDYLFPQLRQNPSSLNGPAVRPSTAKAQPSNPEPTLAFTVPTLVVASPRTLHSAGAQDQQDEEGGPKNNGNETDLDPTAPYETAQSHQEEPLLPPISTTTAAAAQTTYNKDVDLQTLSVAPSAAQQPLVNNPFRSDSDSPPSRRPVELAQPASVPAPQLRQQQQPKPRQPLNRVHSEIADSAAGDSDGFIDSDDGGGVGSSKVSPLKQMRQQSLQRQQQQQQQQPKSANTSTTMKRSATARTAAASTKAVHRPVLGRVASDGLGHQYHQPAIPMGISIDDLIKDTGGAPAKSIAALQQQPSNQQLLPSHQTKRGSGFGRSHSSVLGMSVPENDVLAEPRGYDGSAVAGVSDLPPTQNQVQYLDPEAERMREQLMRKIMGGADPQPANANTGEARPTASAVGRREDNAALRAGTAEEALAEARQSVRRSSRLR
ncbi:DNA replication regulator DPB11 [Sporothrix schenckii 1099-18]|uniref:DNA replication regulator DPB11 n=1 Tax=Sporothrix schenckii 1099-18 TaxID=1397361 RepID=A0A0F2MHY6_SPOSC|nr:DNA replication regulator DPB11 [Sporothrix schenckii 1099-18]KJR89247.1 DNA replication regulator DPB11 [Sporothrix schenckii 1099-18]